MTSLQAFILALVILTIQTITLMVLGFMFGAKEVSATFFLFFVFNLLLIALGDGLCVVNGGKDED